MTRTAPETRPDRAEAVQQPLPGMTGSRKRQGRSEGDFECPVCHAPFATLADFDNHRKDER